VCGATTARVYGQDVSVTIDPQFPLRQPDGNGPRLYVQPYVDFGRVGLWGFAAGEKDYFSAIVGPSVTVAKKGETSFGAGVGAGVETFPDRGAYRQYGRYAGYLMLAGSRETISIYYESGATHEHWTQGVATWQLTRPLAVGALYQTGDGAGPRVIVSVPRAPLQLWAGPMWRSGMHGPTYLFGLDLTLEKKK
jgi:hypothetical protein